jgi:hypothetical protein
VTQKLNSDNQNKHPIPFQVIDAVSLKMRVKETKEETKEEKWVRKESRAVRSPNEALEILLELYNDILGARVFQDDWKTYRVFFILKRDKTNVRLISMASCVCAWY